MKHSTYSVVIIGSGAAGLYAALKISQQMVLPDGILLVTKSKLNDCNSFHAQGGIVSVLNDNTTDSLDLHLKDTLNAGAGLSEPHVVSSISEKSNDVIQDLDSIGVNFDKDENGKYLLTLEAAHSAKRILHCYGDGTGREIVEKLIEEVKNMDDIHVYEDTIAVELMLDKENECKGVIVFNEQTREHEAVHSSAVVIASGGMGQLYKYTSNPDVATGDGVAIAYLAGAEIQDIEFIQFHPTTLALNDSNKRFLISEAVRGEGAKLVLENGEKFMYKYDEREELAPRDIVTRAIFNEMQDRNVSNIFLDVSNIGTEKFQKRFPLISKQCIEKGINLSRYIPVAPAAHYSMGGIKADIEGRTSIKGLYAIGESASTGLHGANRLASNSLLECVVCAYELANYLTFVNLSVPGQIDEKTFDLIRKYDSQASFIEDADILKHKIQDIMWDYVGILRDKNSLEHALQEVKNIKNKINIYDKFESRQEYELRNMILNAILVINGALERKESRGGHYRSDYKFTESRAYHSIVNIKG